MPLYIMLLIVKVMSKYYATTHFIPNYKMLLHISTWDLKQFRKKFLCVDIVDLSRPQIHKFVIFSQPKIVPSLDWLFAHQQSLSLSTTGIFFLIFLNLLNARIFEKVISIELGSHLSILTYSTLVGPVCFIWSRSFTIFSVHALFGV